MEKHCENAMKVATHLSKHPKIEWVRYPGLSRDPMHALGLVALYLGTSSMATTTRQGLSPSLSHAIAAKNMDSIAYAHARSAFNFPPL